MASIGSFVLSLFGIRTITQDFIPVPDQPVLEVDPSFATITPDPLNQRNVLSGPSGGAITATTVTAATSVTVGAQTPAQLVIEAFPSVTTLNSSTVVLATIPVPVGGVADVGARVSVILGSGVNANLAPTMYRFTVPAFRIGSGSAVGNGGSTDNAITAPFLDLQSTPTIGAVSGRVVGNNVLIEAKGFAPPSAWSSGVAYVTGDGSSTVGDFVTSDGSVWVCTTAGTSSGSAPTGTGRAVGTGAKFDRVAAGSAVPVRYTVVLTGLVTA